MSEEQVSNSYLTEDSDVRKLVNWVNPPSVRDLKQDLSDALPNHDLHVKNVNEWISP